MRTPGRCTNHESCWLANGGRDIWVPVGDDFVCPVCAEPLTAPSLQSISMRSMVGAAAASLALVALAGGAGFGLVRAISMVAHGSHGQATAVHPASQTARTAPQLLAARRSPVAVASVNPPVAAPAPPPTSAPVTPKAAPAAPPAAPGKPAPTAVASAAPPAPKAISIAPTAPAAPKAPASSPPATVAAATPPAAPEHVAAQAPTIAPPEPSAALPRQVAKATVAAAMPQRQEATPTTAKPQVTQAASFTKAPRPSGAAPNPAANPAAAQVAETRWPVPPVQAVPPSGPQLPAPHRVVVVQAITYGQPPGPEGESVDSTGHWRHRTPRVEDRTGFLPGPGWSQFEYGAEREVTQPYVVAQGDGEESTPSAPTNFNGGTSVPSMQRDTEIEPNGAASGAAIGSSRVPEIAPQVLPRFDGAAGAEMAPQATPSMVTHLSVPWIAGRMPVDVPAERVDVAAADAIDDAPDAPIRLARLPPAPPAKLALPEYPPVAEDLQEPGRVDVGCTITVRGVPSDCAVTRRVGAAIFAHSVIDWLHSGEVRYRPHLVRGHPVPEARRYDVKFVP
jgi:Gram-negative bacterial TonB protein C-terminal